MSKKAISYAKCINCRVKDDVKNLNKLDSANGGFCYVCDDCTHKVYSYTDENDLVSHLSKARKMTFSFEYEQGSRSLQSNILYEYGFLPTYDCTVHVEWKSPIYRSLCGIAKQLKTMDSIDDTDYRCGTHLNVGCEDRRDLHMDLIRRHYNALFLPLQAHLIALGNSKQEDVFGRALGGWAEQINRSYAQEHTNFINVQHDTHIELRVCKFISGAQYMKLIKYWTDSVELIANEFNKGCNHNTTRSHDEKIAEKISAKLVKMFDKHFC